MNQLVFKYITPLRLVGLWMLIWSIIEYINIQHMIKEGEESGLGGLSFIAFGVVSIMSFSLDVTLSLIFKRKKNWTIQLTIVIICMTWMMAQEILK